MMLLHPYSFFFFFNDTATTEIYTLSLHDALPIFRGDRDWPGGYRTRGDGCRAPIYLPICRHSEDRKSTRLNSSHQIISYAVFCLKKKKKHNNSRRLHSSESSCADDHYTVITV